MRNNKKIFDGIIISIGIFLVIYYLILKMLFGTIAFSNMFCLLGIILVLYGTAECLTKKSFWSLLPKSIKRIIQVFL